MQPKLIAESVVVDLNLVRALSPPDSANISIKSSPAQLKRDIEETILDFVARQIHSFKEATGLDISGVSLQFDTFHQITEVEAPRLIAARVYI